MAIYLDLHGQSSNQADYWMVPQYLQEKKRNTARQMEKQNY